MEEGYGVEGFGLFGLLAFSIPPPPPPPPLLLLLFLCLVFSCVVGIGQGNSDGGEIELR